MDKGVNVYTWTWTLYGQVYGQKMILPTKKKKSLHGQKIKICSAIKQDSYSTLCKIATTRKVSKAEALEQAIDKFDNNFEKKLNEEKKILCVQLNAINDQLKSIRGGKLDPTDIK